MVGCRHRRWCLLLGGTGHGRFYCGSASVAEGSPGWQVLKNLIDATPGPDMQGRDPRAGPLGWIGTSEPHGRERDFAWRLSEAFLPPPLREQALQFLRRQTPSSSSFRLVVSLPAALCRLPIALMALEQPGSRPGQPDVPRLVEAATIHLAPSMALLASITRRSSAPELGSGAPWPLLVSIVDPTDDLKTCQGYGSSAGTLLAGWQRLTKSGAEGSPHSRPATKADVMDTLQATS